MLYRESKQWHVGTMRINIPLHSLWKLSDRECDGQFLEYGNENFSYGDCPLLLAKLVFEKENRRSITWCGSDQYLFSDLQEIYFDDHMIFSVMIIMTTLTTKKSKLCSFSITFRQILSLWNGCRSEMHDTSWVIFLASPRVLVPCKEKRFHKMLLSSLFGTHRPH